TIASGRMLDDWTSYKIMVKSVYGHLIPIMYWLDGAQILALASQSTSTQIATLRMLHETSLQENVLFVYPLYIRGYYDALGEGTYDALKELTNSISTVHTVTTSYSVPFISTTTTTTTTMITETKPPALLENPFDAALIVVVGVLVLAVIVPIFRKRDRKPSGHS
ncbi:MAG TPA: hypothetical protein VLV18_06685, partial [Terriglobales bacterium]|nr:hypothetical protein [Terriglobales bacterium]